MLIPNETFNPVDVNPVEKSKKKKKSSVRIPAGKKKNSKIRTETVKLSGRDEINPLGAT